MLFRSLSLLQNEELLRLHSGHFSSCQIRRNREECLWAAVDTTTGEHYIALFNLAEQPRPISITQKEITAAFPGFVPRSGCYWEVWSGETVEFDPVGIAVPSHGAVLLHMI